MDACHDTRPGRAHSAGGARLRAHFLPPLKLTDVGFVLDDGQLGDLQIICFVSSLTPKPLVTGWQWLTGTAARNCMSSDCDRDCERREGVFLHDPIR